MIPAASPARRSLHLIDRVLLIVSAVILGVTGLMAALNGAGYRPLPARSFCWSRMLLDRECPGCGLSRSFIATALGDFRSAIELNPVGPPLFAILVIVLLTRLARWRGMSWPRNADVAVAAATVLILLARTLWFYLRG